MPPLLLLLLAYSFLLRPAAASAAQPSSCWPKTCGSLNITYPFWVEEPGRPPCGPPAFQLKCNSSGAFLSRSSYQAYRVESIFPKNRSLHVVDFNLPLATGCPAPIFNVSIVSRPLFFSKANKELLFLGKCTESQPEPSAGFHSLPCDSSSFVRLGDGRNFSSSHVQGGIPPSCFFAFVPVLVAPQGNGAEYIASLRKGFLLEWTEVPGNCPGCIASGGECAYGDNGLTFACKCSGSLRPEKCGTNGTGKKIILIVLMSVAASLLLLCIYVLACHRKRGKLCFFLCKKTSSSTERNIEALIVSHGSLAPKRYKYSEVTKITSSLNDKLGEGGYGMVLKGRLDDSRLVAVKFLHDSKGEGEEFVNEVMSIGRTSHVNIVSLFGFCLEGSKRALIYEFMPNGSLDKYIYSDNPKAVLGWEKLYTIAIGIARGLEYLHHSCNTRIIHFDIKPQNILLDQNFHPKIADFGLAKLCRTKESKLSMTGARGTVGFIAPEVHSRTFGVVSTKSDVYSYGMMLLEMVGGRKNVNSVAQKSSENYFPHWIYDHFGHDDGLQACEVSSQNEGIARKMSMIGLWCIQILPMHRPTITKVLEMFERGLDELDMPPRQNFSEILLDPLHSLNAESMSSSSGTKTQVLSEVLRMEEISNVNSKTLRQLPTL
ncbi:LEAF RUST 10 DISEASE-RESISTANCE LOCUS RECEPTOR-LIKE PROTEIN KINASE-like 2.7 isoform X3 [Panicum hallii]|uniref:LEAF RUST 10 DISEASE-RESISTANCE LOCUS RECEPTOR-LIKE PROTEIN KINASE-like 2.7 isoform X3 n=1 Tax=Panicum hallii TaxID=206008 RepID=UPI000DF4E2A2|nr:LEAF RUST 10 DISEASE-RESISTANCE LOCUS RECEPTOR-LIKE PROTEIN KINASE-like 2.7 isoform X3 [Panicum hallii]